MASSLTSARTFFDQAAQQLEKAVRERIQLDYVNKEGVRLRDTLLSVERQSKGKLRDSRILSPTQIPTVCTNVWFAFWEVNRGRQGTGFGPGPLLYSELLAWCQLMGEKLDRWEVSLFRQLDNAYLDEVSRKTSEDS